MPLKKRAQPSEQCSVCCQAIVKGKDEALFCGGGCQQWLHRYCAGVPTQVYKSLTAKGVPFSCFACSLLNHREEIDALKSTVKALGEEIAELKSSSKPSSSPAQKTNPEVTTSPSVSRDDGNPLPVSSSLHERKYNIILYGLDECPL